MFFLYPYNYQPNVMGSLTVWDARGAVQAHTSAGRHVTGQSNLYEKNKGFALQHRAVPVITIQTHAEAKAWLSPP